VLRHSYILASVVTILVLIALLWKPDAQLANAIMNACIEPPTGNEHRQMLIRGGAFTMGSNATYPEEAPARKISVEDFYIDVHEVTNQQFGAFINATGYVTTAERKPDTSINSNLSKDMLVAGSAVFAQPEEGLSASWQDWWLFLEGANWREPQGPGSNITGLDMHPVVHVSFEDALAYATWADRELPTEAQWELAAQASSNVDDANTWQGLFPVQNTGQDGYRGLAPVACYPADANGLYDMKGNVWELVDAAFNADQPALKVVKGGSYLCADSYCRRDRPQARQPQEADFSTNHIGFRTIKRI